MIIPLKKLTVLTVDSAEQIIAALGKIGVMHIESGGKLPNVPELRDELERISEAKHIITTRITGEKRHYNNVEEIVKKIIKTDEMEDDVEIRKATLQKEMEFYNLFGNLIKVEEVSEIKKNNINIHFYETDNQEIKNHALSYFEKDGRIMAVTFEKFVDEKEIMLPEYEYDEIIEEFQEIEAEQKRLLSVYEDIGVCTECLEKYEKQILGKIASIEKQEAVIGNSEAQVNIISGFIRAEDEEVVRKTALENCWAYSIEDSEEGDESPVMLRNIKPVEDIIYPIYDFMGSWPSPLGRDPSFIFALSLIIFGAILIGDAGYGIAFIVAAFALRKKIKLPMLYYLGGGCIIWGSITGTWFCNSWLATATPLKHLVYSGLASYNPATGALNTDIRSTMGLMFTLGGIHLSVAKLMAFSKNIAKNIGCVGDILVIWGMVYVVKVLMAGETNTALILPLLGVGTAIGVFGIMVSKDSIGKKIIGIIMKPVGIVNVFADTMSYIRLFAVGFASLIVGMVGSLIAGMTGNILAGGVIFLVINSINLSLGIIAILVHAVRLNNLEFSNNSEIALGTPKFEPFKV